MLRFAHYKAPSRVVCFTVNRDYPYISCFANLLRYVFALIMSKASAIATNKDETSDLSQRSAGG